MALTIYCDESGYTGPNLFLDDQRYYVYPSVGMPHDQAVDIVAKMRADSRTQAGELKFEKLSKYPRGRDAVRWFLETHGEKIAVFHADKRYSAAGKFFEYTFEPVLRPKRQLFYDIHFHRFVSTFLFDAWLDGDPVARELLEDGQNLIRFKKPEDLKRLLREPLHLPDGDDPLTAIAAFCHAYRKGILGEIDVIGADPDLSQWTMDISDVALLETFHHWGDSGEEIEVYCDDSKPLRAAAEDMRMMATTEPPGWVNQLTLTPRPLLRMPKPVQFVDSKSTMVAIQLADVVAGAARHVLSHPDATEWVPFIEPRCIKNCIYPQGHFIDPDLPQTEVNVAILSELGKRARAGRDPNYAMEFVIAQMMESVAKSMDEE
ncbi:hypothetical protein AYO44_12865 [Planctomycetaceae bacterium SCGC AG-212-F19]|nr:hypothetical protein AYO44_12865 [Planctomycetaceae bacterium SCGC AG-212-F19]